MPFGEQKCFEDTVSVFANLIDDSHLNTKDIVILGRYLGSGPAIHLVANLQREDQSNSNSPNVNNPSTPPSLHSSTSSLQNPNNGGTNILTNSSSNINNPTFSVSASPNTTPNNPTNNSTITTTTSTEKFALSSSIDKSNGANPQLSNSKGLRRNLSQRLSALLTKGKNTAVPYTDVGGLILISPLASALRLLHSITPNSGGFNLTSTLSSLIAHDMFDNVSKVSKIQCPVCLVFDQRLQTALPLSHSQKLVPKIRTLWKFLEIPGLLEDDVFNFIHFVFIHFFSLYSFVFAIFLLD
jgi:hypothetical protein